MLIRLVCHDLPASTCMGHTNIRLGIQKGKGVVQETFMDKDEVVFEVDVTAVDGDYRGPFVHGPKGERFIYLAWSDQGIGFRRGKVHLSTIPSDLIAEEIVVG